MYAEIVEMELSNWASEASPTLGCSIEILRDIYICMSTIVYGKTIQKNCMLKRVGGIKYSKHTHAQSPFWEFETSTDYNFRLEFLILQPTGVRWFNYL